MHWTDYIAGCITGAMFINIVCTLLFLSRRACYYIVVSMATQHCWTWFTLSSTTKGQFHTVEPKK
jgi:hypothetical protein